MWRPLSVCSWPTPNGRHMHWIRVDAYYQGDRDRKSTRLNSSHQIISYAVFCLKKKPSFVALREPSFDLASDGFPLVHQPHTLPDCRPLISANPYLRVECHPKVIARRPSAPTAP